MTCGFYRAAASTILSFLYDLPTVTSADDPTVTVINNFMDRVADYGNPGNYLVEFFSWMLYIPSSLAKWKREVKKEFKFYSDFFTNMFRDVENRLASSILVFIYTPLLNCSSSRTRVMNVLVSLENWFESESPTASVFRKVLG